MSRHMAFRIVRYSAMLSLVTIALVTWAVLSPRPIPVILAMSVGQGIGTIASLMFLGVVVWELKRKNVFSEPSRASLAAMQRTQDGGKDSRVDDA